MQIRVSGGFLLLPRTGFMLSTIFCSVSDCENTSKVRGLCKQHYNYAYRRGDIVVNMDGPPKHRLSNVDSKHRTGVCSICGPTKVRIRKPNRANECRGKNKKRASIQHRQARYKISNTDFTALVLKQSGACAICGCFTEHLVVDHDHRCCPGRITCGKCVRGLLCRNCNIGIGYFNDNIGNLRTAISYLSV